MPKKIFITTFSLLGLALFLTSSQVLADDCSFTFDPLTLKQDMGSTLRITVFTGSLPGGSNKYYMRLAWPNTSTNIKTGLLLSGGKTTVEFQKPSYSSLWRSGNYSIYFGPESEMGTSNKTCQETFSVQETAAQPSCSVTITSILPIDPDNPNSIHVASIADGDYQIVIYNQNGDEYRKFSNHMVNTGSDFTIGTFPPGQYRVTIRKDDNSFSQLQCSPVTLTVNPRATTSGNTGTAGLSSTGSPVGASGAGCTIDLRGSGLGLGGSKTGIQTAIGCVPIESIPFIYAILRLAIVTGGTMTLLVLIGAVFKMITSAGNPDSLKQAQEKISSAIIGILFLVFSLLLLKIIGVDILGIPGFS